jgi:hypothetical protein
VQNMGVFSMFMISDSFCCESAISSGESGNPSTSQGFASRQHLFSNLGTQVSELQAEAAGAGILAEELDLVSARMAFFSAERKLDHLQVALRGNLSASNWKKPFESVKMSLNTAMVLPFFYLGETSTIERLLSELKAIPEGDVLRKAREPQTVLFLYKLRYREALNEDCMEKAMECLEAGYKELSTLTKTTGSQARYHLSTSRVK